MPSSLAQSLFEQIEGLPNDAERVAFIDQLIAQRTPEEDHLEFKHGSENGANFSNETLKGFYGKALSAFANAGVGVLIWGVGNGRDATGRDYANGRAVVPDVGRLCSLLDLLQRHATDPPVLGTKNLPIVESGTRGFVVSFIPLSPHRPHAFRKSAEEEIYYMRVSAHSSPARQSVLRRLFFPEYHSRLILYFHTSGSPNGTVTKIWLHNHGPGTADEVSVMFKTQSIGHGVLPGLWERIETAWRNTSGTGTADFFRAKRSLHPLEMISLGRFEREERFVIQLYARNEPPIEIEYVLLGEHVGRGNQIGTTREIAL